MRPASLAIAEALHEQHDSDSLLPLPVDEGAVRRSEGVPLASAPADLARALDDVVAFMGCLMALDEPEQHDRWVRERQGYEALARAKRSLHHCAMLRGLC